jgi:hypothetical protein
LSLIEISRDYTPEYFCCGFISNTHLCKSVGNRTFKRTKYTISAGQATDDLVVEYKHFNNLPFYFYLTGLIEGDGTIVVPKTERSVKGVLNYASVQIVFHLKDLPLALIIKKVLGEGSIARKKGVNAYILTINSYKGLILIVSIFWKQRFYNLAQIVKRGLSFLLISKNYTKCFLFILRTVRLCTSVYNPLFKRAKYTLSVIPRGFAQAYSPDRKLAEYKHFNNVSFSFYLTGLIEGGGTIIVPKAVRSIKGVLNYPSIQIIFGLKDLPLALITQKELGAGSISKKKGINAYILTINNFYGISLIISILNGNMRTPKIYSLYKLID